MLDINLAHDFENIYTHQWSSLGGKARSDWKCKKCGVTFSHYYHDNPSIRDAIANADIDINECRSVVE